jgi:hypothetical protein
MPNPRSTGSAVRRLAPLACALAAALALTAALPTAASAHETWAFHGGDSARVLASHTYIEIYDHECDGHSVYTRYRMSNGNLGQFTDYDGCGPNRAYRNTPPGVHIVRFQVCEATEGCSAIKGA